MDQKTNDNVLFNEETQLKVSELFKALADPTRIKILYALRDNKCSVKQIALKLKMTQSAISHQLSSLRAINLVVANRHGREMIYELADEHVYSIFNQAIEHVTE